MLGVEKDKLKDQYIYQSKRLLEATERKKQIWKLDEDKRLLLTDDNDKVYALVINLINSLFIFLSYSIIYYV